MIMFMLSAAGDASPGTYALAVALKLGRKKRCWPSNIFLSSLTCQIRMN